MSVVSSPITGHSSVCSNSLFRLVSSVLFISSQAAMAFFLFLNDSEQYTYCDIIVLDDFTPRDIYLSYTILSNGRHCEGSCIMRFSIQHFLWFDSLNRRRQSVPFWVFYVYFIFYNKMSGLERWLFRFVVLILPPLHRYIKYIKWGCPCENNGCNPNNGALTSQVDHQK